MRGLVVLWMLPSLGLGRKLLLYDALDNSNESYNPILLCNISGSYYIQPTKQILIVYMYMISCSFVFANGWLLLPPVPTKRYLMMMLPFHDRGEQTNQT